MRIFRLFKKRLKLNLHLRIFTFPVHNKSIDLLIVRTCNFRIAPNGLTCLYVIWERMMGQEITDSGDNYQLHNIEEWNGECMQLGNYGRDNILQRTIALEIVSRDGKFSHICQHTKRKDYDHIFFKIDTCKLSWVKCYEEKSIVLVIWQYLAHITRFLASCKHF